MSTLDEEDPFWVAAMEGRECEARDELMPDREHEEIGEAALQLSSKRGLHPDHQKEEGSSSPAEATPRWTPAEVQVRTVSVPAGPRAVAAAAVAGGAGERPSAAAASVEVSVREVLSDGVLSVTGGELWPAARILAQVLAADSAERWLLGSDDGATGADGAGEGRRGVGQRRCCSCGGAAVLEVGSGLGVLGLVAARLGARRVVLSEVLKSL